VLVGDSLGMVIQGHDTTVPVTVADVVYHTRAVARGLRRAFLHHPRGHSLRMVIREHAARSRAFIIWVRTDHQDGDVSIVMWIGRDCRVHSDSNVLI
jgi:hypothetical protein